MVMFFGDINKKSNTNNYLFEKATDGEISKEFNKNNIIRERLDLYKNFVLKLTYLLYDSYLGREYIETEEDVKGHFNWAFNKINSICENMNINFGKGEKIYKTFFEYFYLYLYEDDNNFQAHYNFFEKCLNYNSEKTVLELQYLIKLYLMFDYYFDIDKKLKK